MDKVQAVMHHAIFGIQVWVYLALVVAPFVANEIVQRSKSTVAMSLFQFVMRGILKLPAVGVALAAIPGLGEALHKMANVTTGLPPTYKQRRAARKAAKPEKPAEAPDASITTTTAIEKDQPK